ncbi:MAG: hypothetical protein ACP5OE_05365, partial [Thermodesulfobium sp.]
VAFAMAHLLNNNLNRIFVYQHSSLHILYYVTMKKARKILYSIVLAGVYLMTRYIKAGMQDVSAFE